MAAEEVFSNPVAPPVEVYVDDKPHKLTNADFRKLIMTPRAPPTGVKDTSSTTTTTSQTHPSTTEKHSKVTEEDKDPSRNSERKKKKSYYAKIKKEEEEKMAELAEKYRDRARERRDGKNPDYQAEDPSQTGSGAYRAVAPDMKSNYDAAERRRQMIQESKFLGGDMEHTHLVKGLDYALLQKVRSEIQIKVQENEQEGTTTEAPKEDEEEKTYIFKTEVGKRVHVALFEKAPDSNENFIPGRMVYSYNLEEDLEGDIPITVIRSKSDMMEIENRQTTFKTNDVVIAKLTQIFSYLRTGKTNKKQKKKEKAKENEVKADENIFQDAGEYVPAFAKSDKERERDRDRRRRDRDRDRERRDRDRRRDRNDERSGRRSYFSRPAEEEVPRPTEENTFVPDRKALEETRATKVLQKKLADTDYYTECYPGMAEMQDAIDDSDDEADYTKMDLGNKKGPVGRWDFDTQEEYSEYMNQREAMPKAAFQYGVKMADGRRTRRIGKEKDRNAEINKQWQKIQQIMKRRGDDHIGGSKKARYD